MKYIVLIISFFGVSGFAQSDTLNRFDENGKRHGWWVIYLDNDLNEVSDSSDATYCKYTNYYHKYDYFNMGTIGSKKHPLITPTSSPIVLNGKALLDGEYTSLHKNGEVKFSITYEKGYVKDYKEFYDNGQLKTHFDYTKLCCNYYGGFCIYQYNKDGTIKYEGCPIDPVKEMKAN